LNKKKRAQKGPLHQFSRKCPYTYCACSYTNSIGTALSQVFDLYINITALWRKCQRVLDVLL